VAKRPDGKAQDRLPADDARLPPEQPVHDHLSDVTSEDASRRRHGLVPMRIPEAIVRIVESFNKINRPTHALIAILVIGFTIMVPLSIYFLHGGDPIKVLGTVTGLWTINRLRA